MDSPKISRRITPETKVYVLSLCEELVVLLNSRTEFKYTYNKVSYCLRLCILSELDIGGFIYLSDDTVVPSTAQIDNRLLSLVHQRVYRTAYTPVELLLALNGEIKGDDLLIRHLRKHVYKVLEEKSVIKVEKSKFVFNKIKITNFKVLNEITENLVSYLVSESGFIDIRQDVLVICLYYCKGIDRLLVNLTEIKARLVNRRIERIVERYRNRNNTIIEKLLNYLLYNM